MIADAATTVAFAAPEGEELHALAFEFPAGVGPKRSGSRSWLGGVALAALEVIVASSAVGQAAFRDLSFLVGPYSLLLGSIGTMGDTVADVFPDQ